MASALLALGGCGGAEPAGAPGTEAAPGGAATTPAARFTGTIGGDAALEGGCVWLETPDTRYELQLPDGFDVDRDDLTITGPDDITFAVGDEVTVVGDVVEDMATVCQVGPVLDVADITQG